MAHPAIKIDTNVQATKRGFLEDSDDALEALGEEDHDNDELEAVDNEGLPPFLCQSLYGEFKKKGYFLDSTLNWANLFRLVAFRNPSKIRRTRMDARCTDGGGLAV